MPLSTTDLLANINHKFSVLAITETWFKESNVNDLSFEGYSLLATIALIKLTEELGSYLGLLPKAIRIVT